MIIFKKNTEWGNDENDILYLMIEFNDELQRCSPADRYRSWWLLMGPTPHRVHLVLPHLLQRRRRGRVSYLVLSKGGMRRNSFIPIVEHWFSHILSLNWSSKPLCSLKLINKTVCFSKSQNFKKQNYCIKCMSLHIKYLPCNQMI